MTRPVTDRERANALEVRVAELEGELAAMRAVGEDDIPLLVIEAAVRRIRAVHSSARAHPRGAAKLLIYMIDRPGRLCRMEPLLDLLARDRATLPDSVKTTVSRARSFLRAVGVGEALRNVWGEGYVLEPSSVAAIRAALSLPSAEAA